MEASASPRMPSIQTAFPDAKHTGSNRTVSVKTLQSLELSGRPFYGRKRELGLLRNAYQSIQTQLLLLVGNEEGPSSRLTAGSILVQGAPGTGKTALLQHFVGQLQSQYVVGGDCHHRGQPIILQGKCEEMMRQDPFSAMEQAFGTYFRCSKSTTSTVGDSVTDGNIHESVLTADRRRGLLEAIGGEVGVEVLRGVIPSLTSWVKGGAMHVSADDVPVAIADPDQPTGATLTDRSIATISKSHQLQFVFARLIEALIGKDSSAMPRPVLLVLEDLQWSDSTSLDLLVFLIRQKIPGFLLIGSHQECGEDGVLSSLVACSDTIELKNHTQEEIADFVTRELDYSATESQALARAIYGKTQGNFLFTQHLVEIFKQDYQKLDDSSQWEDHAILQRVGCSDTNDAGDVVTDKIRQLTNPQLMRALILASYLGVQFTVSSLQSLSRYLNEQSKEDPKEDHSSILQSGSEAEWIQLLDTGVLEGLLDNSVGMATYQFKHSKFHEAAYGMIPVGPKRDQLMYQIGLFLKKSAHSMDGGDWMLFMAARHWSEVKGNIVDPLDMARLCCLCGTKAIAMTAFQEAAHFLRRGLDSILQVRGCQVWVNQYDLSLELYHSTAEVELLLGNYERGYALGYLVLKKAKCLLDKIPTYCSMEAALGMQNRHSEAYKLSMEVLSVLKVSPSILTAVLDFFHVKKVIRKTSDENLMAMPEMTDPSKIAMIRCLSNTATRAYLSGNMLLNAAIILKQMKLTLRFGLSPDAAVIFASYGVLLSFGMGHPDTARRIGRVARELASQRPNTDQECKTLYLTGSFIDNWSVPFDEAIRTFERANEVGLLSGCHEFGFGAEADAITISFVAGTPLGELTHRLHCLQEEVDYYNMDVLKGVLDPFAILIHHLIGQSEGGASSHIDWKALGVTETLQPDSSNHYTLTWQFLDRMILAFFFNNTDFAEHMLKCFTDMSPGKSYTFCTLGSFFSALIYAKMARKSRSAKHKRLAQKHTKAMSKLVDSGCVKNSHKYDIMKAECMSLTNKNITSVRRAYDTAIASSRESGCCHDHAIANELAGEFLLQLPQQHDGNGYLLLACALYREW